MHAYQRDLNRLLFAEFWERFSYFASLSLLALYLNERLHISEGRASALAGSFAALGYLTPLLGGWLADRLLGSRRALLAGAGILASGYAVLAHPSVLAIYTAMALVSLGSGLYKPSITTSIGTFFPRLDDPRRQSAFSAFYMCINLAAAIAPLTIGTMQSHFGWPTAFGTCALAMLACFVLLVSIRRASAERFPRASRMPSRQTSGAGAGALAVLCVPAMAFFMVYSQSLGRLIFWARDRVDLTLGGRLSVAITPAATCALIPVLAVVLSPAIEPLRRLLGRWKLARSSAGELRLALLFATLSILILAIPEMRADGNTRVWAGWLLASYLMMTLSELLIVPLCLSLIETIAPAQRVATFMGVWYLAAAVGSQLAGDVGRLWGSISAVSYFLLVAAIPLMAFGLLAMLGHRIDRGSLK